MRILFNIRSDARIKAGGDLNLLNGYSNALEERGHFVETCYDHNADLSSFDVAIAFNFDRPYEPLLFLQEAKKSGCLVAIYSVHHKAAYFKMFLKHGLDGKRNYLAWLCLRNPQKYETLLCWIKILTNKMPFSRVAILPTRKMQNNIVKICDVVFTSSKSESRAIAELNPLISSKDKFVVLPHMIQAQERYRSRSNSNRINRVICPGRIESRKNQIAILKVVSSFPNVQFLFVGGKNENQPEYFEKFKSLTELHNNVEYISAVKLEEYRDLLYSSTVFLSASWVEVVSLAELEGYMCGCKMIVSENSYLAEYVSEGITYFSPDKINDLENKLNNVLVNIYDYALDESVLTELKRITSAEHAADILEQTFENRLKKE